MFNNFKYLLEDFMTILKKIISLSMVGSLTLIAIPTFFSQETSAGTTTEVRQQCKRTKYVKGTWKLRIDAIDRDNVGFTENGTETGSAYYLLKFANSGYVKSSSSGMDLHSGTTDYTVYPVYNDSAASYMTIGRAERNAACQVGISLFVIHEDGDGSVAGAIDFVGTGYNDAASLHPNSQGTIQLHNSMVSYYDDTDGWSGWKRANASMTRLLDR